MVNVVALGHLRYQALQDSLVAFVLVVPLQAQHEPEKVLHWQRRHWQCFASFNPVKATHASANPCLTIVAGVRRCGGVEQILRIRQDGIVDSCCVLFIQNALYVIRMHKLVHLHVCIAAEETDVLHRRKSLCQA